MLLDFVEYKKPIIHSCTMYILHLVCVRILCVRGWLPDPPEFAFKLGESKEGNKSKYELS